MKNVSKTFEVKDGRKVEALRDVLFQVSEKEFISIIGRSGCGKSTLLRIIAGLLPKDEGSGGVFIKGKKVDEPQVDVGMVFQFPTLLLWRTVLGNIMLPVEILGLDEEKYKKKALELIELVGIKGFENCYPYELSGGMQIRVSVCRSLIYSPSILLMDEPFGPLDTLTRRELDAELSKIWHKEKKTIFLVTHDVEEGVYLSDRIIVMSPRPGRVKKIIKVNIPRPRTQDIRFSPEFIDICAKVLKELGVE